MKVVLLAGGLGTRLSEETGARPKPMVEIGGMPILWHIMKLYSARGHNDFVVCLGYKGYMIKEFFTSYFVRRSDVRVSLADNRIEFLRDMAEPWTVTLVDTGEDSMTGGRIRRVREHVGDERFLLTYGDGVCDVDMNEVIDFHRTNGAMVTLTAVQPPGRYGALALHGSDTRIEGFQEKPDGDGMWVNGGYFVCEPEVFALIDGDDTVWESEPMQRAAASGRLHAWRHRGFWQSMDTLRDKHYLEALWDAPAPPWKTW